MVGSLPNLPLPKMSSKMNVSFAGCGFLGIYHVGVACCFKKYAPHLLVDTIAGASAGAIAACSLLCDLPIGEMISDVLRVVHNARKRTLGPFSPTFNVQALLLEGLERVLPEDAHKRVNGKLRISLTRAYDMKNVIVSEFNTREELLQALMASSWIPVFSGIIPPKFRGTRYMDGGLSDNLPTLDENTITVSPFCGESDICPRDSSSQLFHVHLANTSIELSRQNAFRFTRILFPPDPETLSGLCKQGFDDALRFLQRHNMLACKRCLSVQSTFLVSPAVEDSCEYDPECVECKEHRQEAMLANVPESVMTVFQDAIDAANKGIMNWIFRHRGMKLLSIATLPYTLPLEITYVMCSKFASLVPTIASTLLYYLESNFRWVSTLLHLVNKHRKELSNHIVCQMDVSQFGDMNLDLDSFAAKNHLNLQVKVKLHGDNIKEIGDKMLSRRSSLVMQATEEGSDGTVENLRKVTQDHDAVLSYIFVDNQNRVQVTEIYEVTAAESDAIFTHNNDEDSTSDDAMNPIGERNDISGSESSLDYGYGNDEIFSDPESEWRQCTDARPEAERQRKASHVIMD